MPTWRGGAQGGGLGGVSSEEGKAGKEGEAEGEAATATAARPWHTSVTAPVTWLGHTCRSATSSHQ